MKPKISSQRVVFGVSGVHGGRLDADGDGVVKVEVSYDAQHDDFAVILFDNTSKADGHYSPVTLSKEHAKILMGWLKLNLKDASAKDPLIVTESDGSQWVALEEYLKLADGDSQCTQS